MNLTARVLGQTAVTKLQSTAGEHVLVVGKDKLTRGDLADVGCYNFLAARYLTAALEALGVESLQQLYMTFSPRDLALPRVGVICLAVLGAAFEARGIGGDNPLENYVKKHSAKLITFDSVKNQIRRAEEATRKNRRRRRNHAA